MDAAWYADPLGRFEGRFFDGENWTSRVSDNGTQSVDPDWPPAAPAAQGVSVVVEAAADDVVARGVGAQGVGEIEGPPPAQDVSHVVALQVDANGVATAVDDPVVEQVSGGQVSTFEDDRAEPAVAASEAFTATRANLSTESPAREVAVIQAEDAETRSAGTPAVRGQKLLYLLGTAALLAGILLLFLPSVFGNDDDDDDLSPPRPSEIAAAQPAESDDSQDDSSSVAAEGNEGSLQVGGLEITNGVATLDDLADWHKDEAADRGIILGDDASCWFASVDDATVQHVYCGPVAGSDASDFVYDVVPVGFEDVGPEQIRVTPQTADTEFDSFVPNGVELVGADLAVDAPSTTEPGARGERPPRGDEAPAP